MFSGDRGHMPQVGRGKSTMVTDEGVVTMSTPRASGQGDRGKAPMSSHQEVTARSFMPLLECPSNRCRTNNAKGNLILQLRASKFLKFQEAKIQELSEHVPKGHIPRSMTVHIRGELTRKVGPGDLVQISGIFLPIPYTDFRAMRAGLVADTYLEAMTITHFKKRYEEYSTLQGDEQEQIERLAEDGDIYNKLARSLAPEIFGHEDVKNALLLHNFSSVDAAAQFPDELGLGDSVSNNNSSVFPSNNTPSNRTNYSSVSSANIKVQKSKNTTRSTRSSSTVENSALALGTNTGTLSSQSLHGSRAIGSPFQSQGSAQQTSGQYPHPIGYMEQRGTTQQQMVHKTSAANEWSGQSHRKIGGQGRSQMSGEKNFTTSKTKQVYVVKPSSSPSNVGNAVTLL